MVRNLLLTVPQYFCLIGEHYGVTMKKVYMKFLFKKFIILVMILSMTVANFNQSFAYDSEGADEYDDVSDEDTAIEIGNEGLTTPDEYRELEELRERVRDAIDEVTTERPGAYEPNDVFDAIAGFLGMGLLATEIYTEFLALSTASSSLGFAFSGAGASAGGLGAAGAGAGGLGTIAVAETAVAETLALEGAGTVGTGILTGTGIIGLAEFGAVGVIVAEVAIVAYLSYDLYRSNSDRATYDAAYAESSCDILGSLYSRLFDSQNEVNNIIANLSPRYGRVELVLNPVVSGMMQTISIRYTPKDGISESELILARQLKDELAAALCDLKNRETTYAINRSICPTPSTPEFVENIVIP